MMKTIYPALLIALSIALSGCEDPKEKSARALLGEGLQAESKREIGDPFQIYAQVIKEYPDTRAAVEAKTRQEAMAEKLRQTAESLRSHQSY